ncbi:MAG: DOMON-like domain-containing protein [Alphaproteobacteria bacterium]|nr:DOMON-like domain-containing protein [Alphaproteobacteria bacterium]
MQRLIRHPEYPCEAVSALAAEAARPGPGRLALRYRLTRGGGDLAVPASAPPARTDGLWKHTCFEAFLRGPGGEAYLEFNLAPSGEWAAYRFSGYREGMTPLEVPPPTIGWRPTPEGWELATDLDLSGLPDIAASTWQVSLTAVIEEAQGRTSYWALAHPAAKPDFHAREGFALTLSAPDA